MTMIYLAAPLFNPQELDFNQRLASIIEKRHVVFLPQRDGTLLPGKHFSGNEFDAASVEVYRSDTRALSHADAVLAVLDGRTIDEGVAFELGFARALGKPCFGLHTDTRVLLPNGINPMIGAALHRTFGTLEELIEFFDHWTPETV